MRVALVCHDAGGTVPPVLAVAEALCRRAHDVAILSQPSVRSRAEAAGCQFFSFSGVADYERRKPLEEQLGTVLEAIGGSSTVADLQRLARQWRPDLFVVDANLAGALAAVEALPQPSAVLLHSMYKTFVDTWFGELWPLLATGVNERRASCGLDAAGSWTDVFSAHDRVLSVVPSPFDAPVDVERHLSAMRHFGFLVPDGHSPPGDAAGFLPGADPAVLVGLTTTYLKHDALLQEILDALGALPVRGLATTAGQVPIEALRPPPNVTLVDFVPHARVLRDTDVVVSHAGLGTVAASLSFGVPLVCTPINRDQPLNAERVAEAGAGVVAPQATASAIAGCVETVLSDPSYRVAAEALAKASVEEGGAGALVADLESLAG